MNKYLFIPPFSNHALHVHKEWIKSYIKRIRLNCTKDIDFLLHKHTFFLRLLVRGYKLKFLILIFNQKVNRPVIIKKLIQKEFTLNAKNISALSVISKVREHDSTIL